MEQVRQKVFDHLEKMGIPYEVMQHPAVYTIDEMNELGIGAQGEVLKNLFLRDDKKKRFFLVVLRNDKKANLDELHTKLGSRKLSFASEEYLSRYLGLEKGSVSPFGILNDDDRAVEVVVDKDLLSLARIGVHPNENTATVWISFQDLQRVIQEHGNDVIPIEI